MNCRHCGNAVELPFLDLGSSPPSNAYLTSEGLQRPELWFPLRLGVCESCWLVQTEDYAGREALFAEDYAYYSSVSKSWLEHAESYVRAVTGRFGLDSNSVIVEVAANDGYLLQFVRARGIPCYGIEPTRSTAQAAREKGIEVIESFFGQRLAGELRQAGRAADLVVANNVLAHVPDPNDFLSGFASLLKPNGVATFEFPHLLNLVQLGQFDTVYHEHYSYLSLSTVERMMESNGLSVFDVEELATHGGSLRVFCQREDTGLRTRTPAVEALARKETLAGVETKAFYAHFQERAEKIKNEFMRFLLEAKEQGRKVGAYGAAAKGNTLLNFAGVKPDLLPYVVDRSPMKQGRYMPGSRIPIVHEDRLKEHRPELIVLLPWNLKPELIGQLSYAGAWGAKIVTAVPEIEVTPFDQSLD